MLHLLTPSQALARRAVALGAAPSSVSSCACSLRTALPSFASPSSSSSSGPSTSSSHFHTSAVAHGKSRPGEGKDAKLRRKKLARAGGVRETKDESTPLEEAIRLLRAVEIARPMNAYELHVVTSVGSHQSNSLRGRIALPRDARTKSEKLVVFASEGTPAAAAALAAKSAAARPDDVVVGGSEMIADVTANRVSGFTKVLATPDLMPQISKELARSLGPRGLMPSAKRGTVVNTAEEMRNAIEEAKGAVDWRGDRQGVVRAGEWARISLFCPSFLEQC